MSNYYMMSFSSHQDRAAALGETLQFFGALLEDSRRIQNAEIFWCLKRNGIETVCEGSCSSRAYALCGPLLTVTQPGHYCCTFTAKLDGVTVARTAIGALAAPETIRPGLPVPSDFDAFWQRQRDAVNAVPLQVRLTALDKSPFTEVFDLQASCTNGTPVSGIFARPANPRKGGHPAVLVPHGAGVRSAGEGRFLSFAAKGFLSLDINAHGLPNDMPIGYYMQVAQEQLDGYPVRGFESGDPEKVYMLGVFHRVYRALQALMDMPEWDGRNLWIFGGSQASWQAFAGACLMPAVSGLTLWIPAGCDMVNGGWPFAYLMGKTVPTPLQRAMAYFDCTSLATRIRHIPVLCHVGLADPVCKADGVMAAYNSLATPDKTLNLHYEMGHETLEGEVADMERFIMAHLKA